MSANIDAFIFPIIWGAIGSMITSGIVGQFVAVVVLTLGFKLFQAWPLMPDPASDQVLTNLKQGQ